MPQPQQAIIGRIPGYNSNIDHQHNFEKELKKGITYIDFYPTAYTDSMELLDATALDAFGAKLTAMFTSPGLVKTVPPGRSTNTGTGATGLDPSYERFKGILTRMSASFGLSKDFDKVGTLRLVAANDSTFTETFTNSFDEQNVITSGFSTLKSAVGVVPLVPQALKGLKSFDSLTLQNMVGNVYKAVNDGTAKSTLADLLQGAALGMNIASPQIWSASQYNSTLTLFIKLVAPTGQPECIKKNILEPLLYLLAASSPITAYGTVYGYPLMWQVHAHGITNFRIGAVAALSIIRGSFETTFTTALQPTVVDVRLTIIPLLTDFAVQTNADNTDSIYEKEMAPFLGVQNPADIVRGTLNQGPMGGDLRKHETPEIVSVRI